MMLSERDRSRFEAKVDRSGPVPAHRPELGSCHVWTACRHPRGYGEFGIGSRTDGTKRVGKAHRVAFFFAHGRWPEPCCLHRCDNPSCVNPDHLFEGTQLENIADRDAKGRHVAACGARNGKNTKPESRLCGERNGSAKLTEQDVRDIRANYALCRVSKKDLGRRFGVSDQQITRIVLRQTWSRLPMEAPCPAR